MEEPNTTLAAWMRMEQMWLDETEYPKDDARPTLGTQEWMEYLLDTSATTAEARTIAMSPCRLVRLRSERRSAA